MSKADIEWLDQGLFTAFLPMSKEGEMAWNDLAKQTDGTGKVFSFQAKQVIASLRQAGYTVKKAKNPGKLTDADLDQMMRELEG